MANPSYARSLVSSGKRLRLSSSPIPAFASQTRRHVQHSSPLAAQPIANHPLPANLERELAQLRLPKAVQATYLAPLKHKPFREFKVAELQLRSHSVRNLEVFTDFALRAAYFLKLPAVGPAHLPRITERWTVPRSNFVHKKSQENFERITMRRKITIMDGHPDTVSIWLAFLRKHQYYGVGMRADVYEQSSLDVAKDLDKEAQRIENLMGKLEIGGMGRKLDDNAAERLLVEEPYKAAWGAYAPSGGAQGVPHANKRIDRVKVVSNPAPQR